MNSKTIIKPQTLKGFRDFLPEEKRKRDYVITKIKEVFELYGFEPIETPTLEYASLLLGKYGEEANKLLYTFEDLGGRKIGLRYDQTIPTARILSQYFYDNKNVLNNPKEFMLISKRYQIQNVFRAEKPQKGRYREFIQCDCDIFDGIPTPIADVEILVVFYKTFESLGIKSFKILVNDRKQLFNTVYNIPGISERQAFSIIQSLDKLDKKSKDEVIDELAIKGFKNTAAMRKLIETLETIQPSPELQLIIALANKSGVPKEKIQFSPLLARGLDYYTNFIFEGVIEQSGLGSIGGGGRYNNLLRKLTGINCSAVGFGIGFDRTVEILDQLNLFPKKVTFPTSKVLVTYKGDLYSIALEIASKLRKSKINTEVYTFYTLGPNLETQLKYANRKGIPYVIIIGPDEVKANQVALKNMKTGEQDLVNIERLITILGN